MFSFFKALSQRRGAWLLLILSGVALEGSALYFQHGMGLKPCVMCIYERVALFVILAAGILGWLAPKLALVRWFALGLGLFGAIKGINLALKHTDYQLNPGPWNQCSPFVDFPETLPLNQWLPAVFEATGDCSKITWQFLGFSMPQWLIVVFAVYIAIFAFLILSQFKRNRQNRRSIFH